MRFCADLIAQGKEPACSTECPKKAMLVLPISQAEEKCKSLANDRFVYGKEENGGTATWYVCSVPFEKINRQLHSQLPKNHPERSRFKTESVDAFSARNFGCTDCGFGRIRRPKKKKERQRSISIRRCGNENHQTTSN